MHGLERGTELPSLSSTPYYFTLSFSTRRAEIESTEEGSEMQEQKQMAKALSCVAREADAFQTAIFDGSSKYQFHIVLSSFVSSSFLV